MPDQVVVWGIEEDGGLIVLCVENVQGAAAPTVAALTRVADALSLAIVHWCRCQAYAASGASIANAAGAPWDGAA